MDQCSHRRLILGGSGGPPAKWRRRQPHTHIMWRGCGSQTDGGNWLVAGVARARSEVTMFNWLVVKKGNQGVDKMIVKLGRWAGFPSDSFITQLGKNHQPARCG